MPADPAPIAPIPADEAEARPVRLLRSTLRRIDGWGPLAWKEILGAWRTDHGFLVLEQPEWEAGCDEDERLLFLVVDHALGGDEPLATADWLLRHAWATLLAAPIITAWTLRPAAAMRATTACWIDPERPGRLVLRLQLDLPYAGMCIDARRLGRFLKQVDRWMAALTTRQRRADLARHRQVAARHRALQQAMAETGVLAFLGVGSVLPRAAEGGPLPDAQPLAVPRSLRTTIDLGAHGRVSGLAIRRGITAIAGAPYHGKSTLLAAVQAGIEPHPPGDGRELTATDPTALLVQAEDGRRIKDTDLTTFFRSLPGADAARFATTRASGATSMAASVLHGVAGGCGLLLIDEDTAASNFLHVDPAMRQLLGRAFHGTTTLLEVLSAFVAAGTSTVLVAGSTGLGVAAADRVIMMERFQPRDGTAAARRLLDRRSAAGSAPLRLRSRRFRDDPDCLLGPRHFLPMDVTEPERPRLKVQHDWWTLDLRRLGWPLDAPLTAGALAMAAWCVRLSGGDASPLELRRIYSGLATDARLIDPFHTRLISVPPWPLVLAVIERLPRPWVESVDEEASRLKPALR